MKKDNHWKEVIGLRQLIINKKTKNERIALLENGRLAEIWINDQGKETMVGNIYKGRVIRVLPGMEAAFVDFGEERNGYLHRNDLVSLDSANKGEITERRNVRHFISQGEEVIVQVVKDSNEYKGPKLSMNIEIKCPFFIYQPFGRGIYLSKKITSSNERKRLEILGKQLCSDNEGMIFRTAAEHVDNQNLAELFYELKERFERQAKSKQNPSLLLGYESFVEQIIAEVSPFGFDEIVVDDADTVAELKKTFGKYESVPIRFYSNRENIFSYYAIEQELEKALKKVVWLKNGAFIVIEETEALNVIDVNTGKFSGKSAYRETVFQTNEEAAKEIVRQIRLRNLSGIILIDFIDMEEEDRGRILKLFERELEKDRIHTKIIGFTELNILQLTRKKIRNSLSELMLVPCPACGGTGRRKSTESVALALERKLLEFSGSDHEAILIEAEPDVCAFFQERHIKQLEKALNMKIFVLPADDVHGFAIRQSGTETEVVRRMTNMY